MDGCFDIAPDGTIYLTSGNLIPSKIFEVKNGKIKEIAMYPLPLMRLRYVENIKLKTNESQITVMRGLLITGYGRHIIYLYDLTDKKLYIVYDNSDIESIEDVALIVPDQPHMKDQLTWILITSVAIAVILIVLVYMRQKHKSYSSSSIKH